MKSKTSQSLIILAAILAAQNTLAQSGGGFGGSTSPSTSGGSSTSPSSSSGGGYGGTSSSRSSSSSGSSSSVSSTVTPKTSYNTWEVRNWAERSASEYLRSNPSEVQLFKRQVQEIQALVDTLSSQIDFITNPQNTSVRVGSFNFAEQMQSTAQDFNAEAKNALASYLKTKAKQVASDAIETNLTQNLASGYDIIPQAPAITSPRLEQNIKVPGLEEFASILSENGVSISDVQKAIESPQFMKSTALKSALNQVWYGFRGSLYDRDYDKVTRSDVENNISNGNTFESEFMSYAENYLLQLSNTRQGGYYETTRDSSLQSLRQFAKRKAQALGQRQATKTVSNQSLQTLWSQQFQSTYKGLLNDLKTKAFIASDFKGEIISESTYFLPGSILSLRVDQITNIGGGTNDKAAVEVYGIKASNSYISISKPQSRSTQPFVVGNIGELEPKNFGTVQRDGRILLATDKQIVVRYVILNVARTQTINFKLEDALAALVKEEGKKTDITHPPVAYLTELLSQEFALKHKDRNAYAPGNFKETPALHRVLRFIAFQNGNDQKMLKSIFRNQVSRIQGRKLTIKDSLSTDVKRNFKVIENAFK